MVLISDLIDYLSTISMR